MGTVGITHTYSTPCDK